MNSQKRETHTAKRLGIAKTLRAASTLTKLPTHVFQAAKSDGCKAFRANGTVDCDELLEWVAKHPQPENAGAPNYYVEQALEKRATRLLKEQKLLEAQKLVWPIEKIRVAWTRNVIACKTKLQASDSAIAAECQMRLGLSNEQLAILRESVRKNVREALKEMHAGEWGKTECPNCKQEIKE